MLRLSTFGSVDLQDPEGRDLRPVLAQPKRLALLVYLAVARPFGVHRRDELLALFWPDLDDTRARDALNQALRFLRQALGPETFVRRGGEDVGIDPEHLWCDAVAFQAALDGGRPEEALELYRGDFLQGFFIEEGGGFEVWMERERAALRESAARGARQVAELHASGGALTLAIDWGRKALELAPDDERALRRLLRWYDRAGDRAGAFRAYEAFARRFEEEFGGEPSAETRALAEQIRVGRPLDEERGAVARGPVDSPLPFGKAPGSEMGERYRIVRKLGAGGMATVYLAMDVKHDREVALKVLRPEIAEGLARERFLREIRIAGQLQHPNIVPLFDSGTADGRLYFVMAHIQGETLRERLAREKRFEVSEVMHLLREVAGALAYAHERGVVHRDIKPENILLIDRRAVLSDFGIARAAHAARTPSGQLGDTLTQPGTSLGTPAYMAPEQAAGNPRIDHRADLYALGVLGYELLAGRPPFVGTTPQQVVVAQLLELPAPIGELRPDTPVGLGTLIMRCLEKEPEARPGTAKSFLAELDGEAGVSRRVSWRQRLEGRSRLSLRRGLTFGILTLLLITAIVSIPAVRRRFPLTSESPRSPSEVLSRIAVLYFDDASADGRLRGLARGVTEDLIDALASVSGLTVISRNGVRPYEGKAFAPDAVGRALNVGLLIDGTVAPAGQGSDSVALSVRLVDARSGVQLERETLSRLVGEPARLQRDLTALVEMSLRRHIGAHVRLRKEQVAAGSDAAWQLLRRARELKDEAAELDPPAALRRFDAADSLLASAENVGDWIEPTLERASLALFRITAIPESPTNTAPGSAATVATILQEGIGHATRALRKAPQDARALAYRGDLRLRLWMFGPRSQDLALLTDAKQDLLRASALDPGLAKAWYVLSEVHRSLGEEAEADLVARKALATDIFARDAPPVLTGLWVKALAASAQATSDSLCAVGRLHFPKHPTFKECPFTVLAWLGGDQPAVARADTLLRALDQDPELKSLRPYRLLLFSALLARAGLRDSARTVMRSGLAEARSRGLTLMLEAYEAHTELLLGNQQRALGLLGALVKADSTLRPQLAINPWFRSLRSNPQFRRLMGQDG